MGIADRYQARLEHLFSAADRLSRIDYARYSALAAKDGHLQSGRTFLRTVEIVERRAAEAITEALAAIDRIPGVSEKRRHALRYQLQQQTLRHMRSEVADLGFTPKAFGGSEEALRVKHMEQATERLLTLISQHATGFTPAQSVSWVAAHQSLAFVITSGLSALAIILSLAALLTK